MCIAALVPLVALTLLPQAPYAAQQRPTDPYRVEWENDQVRVARVTLAPGQSLDTAAPNGRVVIFLTADLDGRLPSHEAAWVEDAAPGTVLGIGTEIHMVRRMAREHPDLTVVSLDPLICPCSTMFRIDGPHLAWCLEALARGEVVNQIVVDQDTAEWARVALQRMLDIT